MRSWSGLLILTCLSVAGRLEAQACETGRVPVDGGYCCWPGQTFDVAANRCSDPPSCPEGFLGSGADCVVAPATAAEPALAPPGETAPDPGSARVTSGRGWDPEHDDTRSRDRRMEAGRGWSPEDPRAAIPPRSGRRPRVGLLAGGAAVFFPIYVLTTIGHALLGSAYVGGSVVAPLWPLTFIPVFHNLAMIDNGGGSNAEGMWVIGTLAGMLEVAGLVMLIVGQVGSEELLDATEASVEVSLLAGAPNADAGASVRLRF